MSDLLTSIAAPPEPPVTGIEPSPKGEPSSRKSWIRKLAGFILAAVLVGAAALFAFRAYRSLSTSSEAAIPTVKVQRGDLSLAITAKAELRGGNPQVLTAPMTGEADMHITTVRKPGDQLKAGDVVVQLNTSEQEFKLKEAQADLAEADQHLIQASAQREADKEEDHYAIEKAEADIKVAELDVRKNPLLATIVAKQNDLALEAARDHLAQLQKNIANRQATGDASIAIQQAGRAKALAQIKTATSNIEAMTLRAQRPGYASIKPISPNGIVFRGMVLPPFQAGDSVRPGMAIAEIPDFNNWELTATMEELDRGHIAIGDNVAITVVAVPGHKFHGKVKNLGGTTDSLWDRHFECKISLDDPVPALRPGMSALIVMTTDEMRNVLWLPAQALFEADGRTFVYLRTGKSFATKDVKLVRRNETRAIVSGLKEGQEVALSNPTETSKKGPASSSALKSLPK